MPYAICKSVSKLTGVADGVAVQEVLNSALKEDKLDDGCVRYMTASKLQLMKTLDSLDFGVC
jgi:hypothetical protein